MAKVFKSVFKAIGTLFGLGEQSQAPIAAPVAPPIAALAPTPPPAPVAPPPAPTPASAPPTESGEPAPVSEPTKEQKAIANAGEDQRRKKKTIRKSDLQRTGPLGLTGGEGSGSSSSTLLG